MTKLPCAYVQSQRKTDVYHFMPVDAVLMAAEVA